MAFPTPDELQTELEPLAAQFGYDIERLEVNKAGAKSAVKIAVDSDERPDLDGIEEFSGAVSTHLDQVEGEGKLSFGPGYTLEITTPGVDMPLTQRRHWARNVGKLVNLPGGGEARVAQVGEDVVYLATVKDPAKNTKKGQVRKRTTIRRASLDEVSGATVDVEFKEPPREELELVALPESAYDDRLNER